MLSIVEQFIIITLSGLYTCFWGAFKDSPYENFKIGTFLRSVWFSWAIWLFFMYGFPRLENFSQLNAVQLFFFVMGIERFLAELYKGFFRFEDQSKYFIPSRFTFFGKPVASEWVRIPIGVVLVSLSLAAAYLPFEIHSFLGFFIVAYLSGLLVSFGGAYKDAPFEGFSPLKFQRSALVLAVMTPYFWIYGEISLGILICMNGGLERFLVEYYKTYIKQNMSGKFRPDLPIFEKQKLTRTKFHYAAWVIILAVIIMSFLSYR